LLTEIYDTHVFNPPANIEEDEEDGKGYEGATVIDTIKGFYGGPLEQIILLDFMR
jgi:DNA polymerase elongation subunit (family B)